MPPTGAVEVRGLADTNPSNSELNSELIPNRSELAEEVKAGAGAETGAGAEERDRPRRSHSRLELDTAGAGAGAGLGLV